MRKVWHPANALLFQPRSLSLTSSGYGKGRSFTARCVLRRWAQVPKIDLWSGGTYHFAHSRHRRGSHERVYRGRLWIRRVRKPAFGSGTGSAALGVDVIAMPGVYRVPRIPGTSRGNRCSPPPAHRWNRCASGGIAERRDSGGGLVRPRGSRGLRPRPRRRRVVPWAAPPAPTIGTSAHARAAPGRSQADGQHVDRASPQYVGGQDI